MVPSIHQRTSTNLWTTSTLFTFSEITNTVVLYNIHFYYVISSCFSAANILSSLSFITLLSITGSNYYILNLECPKWWN